MNLRTEKSESGKHFLHVEIGPQHSPVFRGSFLINSASDAAEILEHLEEALTNMGYLFD